MYFYRPGVLKEFRGDTSMIVESQEDYDEVAKRGEERESSSPQ
jgi:hypothetical protein